MTRILAISDIVEESLYGERLEMLDPELVVACGDLPWDYLEYVVTVTNRPLLFVPGNHDPDLRGRPMEVDVFRLLQVGAGSPRPERGPRGAVNVDGRIADATGVAVAGLGGSRRYSGGPNQYTEAQMRWRTLRLQGAAMARRAMGRRRVDVLITHAPPLGFGEPDDVVHRGFASLRRLARTMRPRVLIHGHVHPPRGARGEQRLGETRVINAVGHRIVEV